MISSVILQAALVLFSFILVWLPLIAAAGGDKSVAFAAGGPVNVVVPATSCVAVIVSVGAGAYVCIATNAACFGGAGFGANGG